MDIKGIDDEVLEASVGAVVVRRSDGNDAPRKEIILQKPSSWSGTVVLTRSYGGEGRVKVFTGPGEEATEITFAGGDNEFSTDDLPKSLYVQGHEASSSMRDVTLTLSKKPDGGPSVLPDHVTFTVLWVEIEGWKSKASEDVSPTDSIEDLYTLANDDGNTKLGPHNYTDPGGVHYRGWGYEIRAKVHPPDFDKPVGWWRDTQVRSYSSGTAHNGRILVGQEDWTAGWPDECDDSNDGPRDQWQDKQVDNEGRIFTVDWPWMIRSEKPASWLARRRVNFNVVTVYTGDGLVNQRCSKEWKCYVRYSLIQRKSPRGDDWIELDNLSEEDNKAKEGERTKLSWDLESPTIQSITPNSGVNTGPIAITDLSGTSFVPGAKAKLRKAGQADIEATGVSVTNNDDAMRTIECTFDLTGKPAGQWKVVIENPADTEVVSEESLFTITEP